MAIKTSTASRISQIIIFLALIRCLGEFFRLQHALKENFTVTKAKPFVLGAMVAAIALLGMTILSFYAKHIAIIIVAVMALAALIGIKILYEIAG